MAAQLGPAKGKDFDTGNALGPWIVTTDEIGDPHTLKMDARVNGERWGGGNSGDMHHNGPPSSPTSPPPRRFYAGEVIGSGTVGRAAAWRLVASSSTATWWSWRSSGSACCGTGYWRACEWPTD